ncbi:MAG: acyl-CoA dehydrogenase [Pseudomonadota bacterium]
MNERVTATDQVPTQRFDAERLERAVASINAALERAPTTAAETQIDEAFHAAWRLAAAAGLLTGHLPEDRGGHGWTVSEAVRAQELLGLRCVDAGFVFAVNVAAFSHASTLAECASADQRDRYLGPLSRGERVMGYAITEPDAGSDALALTSRAQAEGANYRLSGEKIYVTLGGRADFALVFASTAPERGAWGLSAFLVDLDLPGVSVTAMTKAGLDSVPMARLRFDEVRLPADVLVGKPGAGRGIFDASQLWERSFVLAAQIGTMQRQLDAVIEHARNREQFGARIGSFQAVSHRIVDMRLRLENARLLQYEAARRKDAGESLRELSALVKLQVSEAFTANSLDAVRVFGGAAYVDEALAVADLRDSLAGLLIAGTNDVQKNIVASLMGLK